MEGLISRFLSVSYGSDDGFGFSYSDGYGYGDGSGCGDGSGSGYGYGYGYGSTSGSGSGSGFGFGFGDGYGSGFSSGFGDGSDDGDGISKFNGNDVYLIDGVQTIIKSIKGNVAKGFILNVDLTLEPTFIAKVGDSFAHGKSAREALDGASAKHNADSTPEERVQAFIKSHPSLGTLTGREWVAVHRQLTLSCEQGCESFVRGRGIDLSKQYTLSEFIKLVDGAYPDGQEAIDLLKQWAGKKSKEDAN